MGGTGEATSVIVKPLRFVDRIEIEGRCQGDGEFKGNGVAKILEMDGQLLFQGRY